MVSERNQSIVECHRLGLGHAAIARDFGLSRERVRQIIGKALGSSTPLKRQALRRRTLALQAMHRLESGQDRDQVAEQLDLSSNQLKDILREQLNCNSQTMGFQGWMAQQLGRRFGSWVVLAIEPGASGSLSTMRCWVTARCERCEHTHRVTYRTLAMGTSTMCHACGIRCRHTKAPVRDLLSGTVYPSLEEAAQAQGLSVQQVSANLRSPRPRFARLSPKPPKQKAVCR